MMRARQARRAAPALSPCLPVAEQGEGEMNWLKKVLGTDEKPAPKPAPKEETPKKTLRIEPLEERITPNAIWGD